MRPRQKRSDRNRRGAKTRRQVQPQDVWQTTELTAYELTSCFLSFLKFNSFRYVTFLSYAECFFAPPTVRCVLVPRHQLSFKSYDSIALIGISNKMAGRGTPPSALLHGCGPAPELLGGLAPHARAPAGAESDHS